ncbi:MAG: DNA internalization-related competence protein ComEC/Rec2 [Lentisphaeria bacterium]|nr:DNA internalization-related competence protein ComEC/Rec2 [Candidatus Neomarinimicrobiota bacterium]MCF7842181.1 DNA internalization-related competence protein ComEC/Rec2 [Lentisphaeria bacterium]
MLIRLALHTLVVQRPLFFIAVCFMGGLLLQSHLNLNLLWLIAGQAALILLLMRRSFLVVIALLLITSGMLRLALVETPHRNDIRFAAFQPDSTYQFTGVVSAVGESSTGKQRLNVDVFALQDTLTVTGSVWSYLKEPLPVEPGDTLSGRGVFRKPLPRANPMDFDFRAYLEQKQVFWLLYPPRDHIWQIRPDSSRSFQQIIQRYRTGIAGFLRERVPGQPGYLLSALILGLRNEVDEEIIQWFSNTGVIHVLAVSGLHVGYVTLILFVILGFFRLPYRMQVLGTILGLGIYSLLTGGAPSVLRASTMAGLYLWGTTLERKVDLYNLLGAAAVGMLLITPNQLWRVGFQLSFAAVFSIAYFYPRLKALLPDPWQKVLGAHTWLTYTVDLFLVSLAAQIGTLPFTIAYFHKIPIVGLMANLVVIPLIGVIVALGFALLLLGSWIPLIGGWWAALLTLLLEILVKFVEFLQSLPLAYVDIQPIHFGWLLLFILSSLVLFSNWRRKGMALISTGLVLANFLVWRPVFQAPQPLTMAFLNVGQGDGVVVQTPGSEVMVIDCGLRFGGKDMGADVLGPYLNYLGEDTIDLMILSHPHNDHVGGAPWLLRHFPVKQVWQAAYDYDSFTYHEIQHLIDSLEIPVIYPLAGDIDSSFAPVYLRVLAPDSTVITNPPSVTNDASITFQLLFGELRVIFTGDAEHGSEYRQTRYKDLLRADIIKVPHHGSRTSSTSDFVNWVQSDWAVISVGRGNKFRHPASVTVARYEQLPATVLRTDIHQAVIFQSDGEKIWLVQP